METLTYLSGAVRQEILGMRADLGVILTPMMGNRPDLSGTKWAADTGCYSQPERHTDEGYLNWLDRLPRHTNLFATAPDVVADAVGTWERSKRILPQIRELGFDAALVIQDGIEYMDVRWDSFDAAFIGGSTEWKLSLTAWEFCQEARAHGKHVHWGRVNSLKRMWRARKAGANSADGTYITFAPDLLLPRVCRWLDKVNAQPRLIPDSIALYAPAHPGCAVRHCGAEVVGAIAHRQESRAVCEVHGTQLVRELGWRWVVPQ